MCIDQTLDIPLKLRTDQTTQMQLNLASYNKEIYLKNNSFKESAPMTNLCDEWPDQKRGWLGKGGHNFEIYKVYVPIIRYAHLGLEVLGQYGFGRWGSDGVQALDPMTSESSWCKNIL